MLRAIKSACPGITTVYGGVYPTYHAKAILLAERAVDIVVRGEGEATAVELAEAICAGGRLDCVAGLACRAGERVILTRDRPPMQNLDRFRTGWELIDDWDRYRCFGLGDELQLA